MFELHMATTLQLRFVFARHCNVFSLRHSYVIHLFVVVTFFLLMFYFGTFELGMEIPYNYVTSLLVIVTLFYYVTNTLLICLL